MSGQGAERARPATIEHLLRDLSPQVLGLVVRRFRDFAAAEDAVQEALLAAAMQWPREGLPDEPRAWLVRVASRRIADHVRAETARRRRETFVVSLAPPEEQLVRSMDDDVVEEHDDTLALLFTCCHPALSPTSQIALTLRAVGGLTTAEIARAFFVPEATMAQRISRAKQSVKTSESPLALPDGAEAARRLGSVLSVLYLIFNEGYAASFGASLQRHDLAAEALRLARMLAARLPEDAEVLGLLALLLLTDARKAARTRGGGELVPLDEQDRSLWDRAAITEGTALLTRALGLGQVGPYQLQAAIAAVHDEGASTETTDWPQILALYGLLLRMQDNPMVALSHAVALAMVQGPAAGLARLDVLANDPRLRDHHRLAAVRGHLHERAGDPVEARAFFLLAADRTDNAAERVYLVTRAAKLLPRSADPPA